MPKFPSEVKVINIKVKVIILWIWKGHFCIVCQKVGGPGPSGPPGSYVLLLEHFSSVISSAILLSIVLSY